MSKIITRYWAKPIPDRQFDWSAHYDGDEPNDAGQMMVGFGKTKEEALIDLARLFAERAEAAEDRLYAGAERMFGEEPFRCPVCGCAISTDETPCEGTEYGYTYGIAPLPAGRTR